MLSLLLLAAAAPAQPAARPHNWTASRPACWPRWRRVSPQSSAAANSAAILADVRLSRTLRLTVAAWMVLGVLGVCLLANPGSVEAGKWADLCCVDLRTPGSWPVHDVIATLVHACSSRQVTDTWVAGRHLYAEGTLRYLDEAAVLERADAWRKRIDAGTGGSEQ